MPPYFSEGSDPVLMLSRKNLVPTATRLVEPANSMTVPGTPITPSPFKSCWKLVSNDCSALLLADKMALVDVKLPLPSVVQTEY